MRLFLAVYLAESLQVYLTVLPKNGHDRKTIYKSVVQILQLHEDLITELRDVVRNAEATHSEKASKPRRLFSRHIRWHSLESTPPKSPLKSRLERFARHSIDTSQPSLIQAKPFMADTKLVLGVAKVFDKLVSKSPGCPRTPLIPLLDPTVRRI